MFSRDTKVDNVYDVKNISAPKNILSITKHRVIIVPVGYIFHLLVSTENEKAENHARVRY